MRYQPPVGSSDPNAPYVARNVEAGQTAGSRVPRGAIEHPMREIVAAIVAAGLTPSDADLTQLVQAILILGSEGGGDAGPVVASLLGRVSDVETEQSAILADAPVDARTFAAVAERLADAFAELTGTATPAGDTLGKVEARIEAERDRLDTLLAGAGADADSFVEMITKVATQATRIDALLSGAPMDGDTFSEVAVRLSNAVTSLIGAATSGGNTLGKLEARAALVETENRRRSPTYSAALFGLANAIEIDIDEVTGAIVRVRTSLGEWTATGFRPSGTVQAALFGQADATEIDVDVTTGVIVRTKTRFATTTALGVEPSSEMVTSPLFAQDDAVAVTLGTDGKVYSVETPTASSENGMFLPRNIYLPMTASATTKYASYDEDPVIFLPFGGQSLMRGRCLDVVPLVSSAAVYPGKALMPVYDDGAAGVRVNGRRIVGFTDLVEAIDGPDRETPCSSTVNHFIQLYEAFTGKRPTVVAVNVAISSQEINNLNEGSASFVDLRNAFFDTARIYGALNRKVVCPGAVLDHGQNGTDSNGGPGQYRAAMQQMQAVIAALARSAFGQTREALLFMFAIDAGVNRDLGDANFFRQASARVQMDLQRSGGPFRVIGPDTFAEYAGDHLHKVCVGSYRMGLPAARALFNEICGIGHAPMMVVDYWMVTAAKLRLECNIPGDYDAGTPGTQYEIEPNFATVGGEIPGGGQPTNTTWGLQARNGSGLVTISSLDVANPNPTITKARYLDVNFAAAPGPSFELAIALKHNGESDTGRGRCAIASTLQHIPIAAGVTPVRDYLCPDLLHISGY